MSIEEIKELFRLSAFTENKFEKSLLMTKSEFKGLNKFIDNQENKIQSQAKEIEELKSGKNTMVYGGRQIGKTYLNDLEKENTQLKQKLQESEDRNKELKELIKDSSKVNQNILEISDKLNRISDLYFKYHNHEILEDEFSERMQFILLNNL